MAVKFPLEVKNGVKARNISELKENFDVEKVVGYFLDGRLKSWLESRYYEEEAEAVDKLSKEDDLARALCSIFGIEYTVDEFNQEEVESRYEKLAKLKQITTDEDIINNINLVAFNQEDLAELYDNNAKKIYLCEGTFTIPKSKLDIDYTFVGNVTVENITDLHKNSTPITYNGETIKELFRTYKLEEAYEKICVLANEKNDDVAQFLLSEFYRHGYGNVSKSVEEGKKYRNLSAEKGNVLARLNLAYDYPSTSEERQRIIDETYFDVMTLASEGDWLAQYELACVFEEKGEFNKAFKLMQESAKADFWKATYRLGDYYWLGNGVDTDYQLAIKYFQKSAEQGYPLAMCKLGQLYFKMNNKEASYYWFEQGSEAGDYNSQNLYAETMRLEKEPDEFKIYNLFKMAADAGYIKAKINIALCYYEGFCVISNVEKAKEILLELAGNGNADAMYHLGKICYEIYTETYGNCSRQNRAELEYCEEWLEKAIEKGQTDAMAVLGYIYYFNHSWYRDARDMYLMGSEKGNVECQCLLANWYSVDGDKEQCVRWYKEAASRGSEKAREWLEINLN